MNDSIRRGARRVLPTARVREVDDSRPGVGGLRLEESEKDGEETTKIKRQTCWLTNLPIPTLGIDGKLVIRGVRFAENSGDGPQNREGVKSIAIGSEGVNRVWTDSIIYVFLSILWQHGGDGVNGSATDVKGKRIRSSVVAKCNSARNVSVLGLKADSSGIRFIANKHFCIQIAARLCVNIVERSGGNHRSLADSGKILEKLENAGNRGGCVRHRRVLARGRAGGHTEADCREALNIWRICQIYVAQEERESKNVEQFLIWKARQRASAEPAAPGPAAFSWHSVARTAGGPGRFLTPFSLRQELYIC